MLISTRVWRSMACLVVASFCLGAAARPALRRSPRTELAFPAASDSLESLQPALAAVTLLPKHVVMLAKDQDFLVFTDYPFMPAPPPPAISRFVHSKRQKLPLSLGGAWHGLVPVDDKLLLLSGDTLTLAYLSQPPVSLLSSHTLMFDLIRPAPDRGGEAPASEVAELRARFRKAYTATPGAKLVGIAPVPASWAGKGSSYFLATRLPGFPLVIMSCTADNPSQCSLTRACLPDKLPDLPPEAIAGIAVSARQHLVLFGDHRKHRLLALRYQSCLHSSVARHMALPSKLKTLTNLYVDADETLWLTTKQPDDYHNASLYRWPAGSW